jgi:hypothetical protein
MEGQYEILSPWAEVEPRPLHGISSRVADLSGKKIGLFCNSKHAAAPIMTVVEKELRERLPASEFSRYDAPEQYSRIQVLGGNKARFEEWLKGVDAVIAAVGD